MSNEGGNNGNGADPSPNGNGKDERGRFVRGNTFSIGNPQGAAFARFRAALPNCVSEDDFTAVIKELVKRAKKGEPWAVKEFLNRILGKSKETIKHEGLDFTLADAIRELEKVNRG